MEIKQYEIYWTDLDPTKGSEIQKIRPCLIISPDEMNRNLNTIIIAPMTTKSRSYPTRIQIEFDNKVGYIILDQIRTLDKQRLREKSGVLDEQLINKVKDVIKEMLVD